MEVCGTHGRLGSAWSYEGPRAEGFIGVQDYWVVGRELRGQHVGGWGGTVILESMQEGTLHVGSRFRGKGRY